MKPQYAEGAVCLLLVVSLVVAATRDSADASQESVTVSTPQEAQVSPHQEERVNPELRHVVAQPAGAHHVYLR